MLHGETKRGRVTNKLCKRDVLARKNAAPRKTPKLSGCKTRLGADGGGARGEPRPGRQALTTHREAESRSVPLALRTGNGRP